MKMVLRLFSVLCQGSFLLATSVACADGWSITQDVDLDNHLTMSQTGSAQASQALNHISIDKNATTGTLENSRQTIRFGGKDLTLRQAASTHSSYQAANLITAGQVTNTQQTLTGVGVLHFHQAADIGDGNVQAGNAIISLNALPSQFHQRVTADEVVFEQEGGANNIQAGNFARTGEADITQGFDVTSGNVLYYQAGTDNVQAGNVVLMESSSLNSSVTQNFTAAGIRVDYSSTDSNGSVKTANYFHQKQ